MGDNQRDEMELVVVDETANTVYRGRISGKGYRKSLESGELWVLHPETRRLLPLGDGVAFLSIEEREGVVEAIVSDSDGARLATGEAEPSGERQSEDRQPGDRRPGDRKPGDRQPGDRQPRERPRTEHRTAASAGTESGALSGNAAASSRSRSDRRSDEASDPRGPELAELDRTVGERRRAGGEGSYTAYLFEQGESKIRKKLGEEAIELCLSEDDRELISESADLLYHLSVLLAVRGLSYADVMNELRRRRDE